LAFDFLTLRRAHFFYSSVNSLLTLLVTNIRAKSWSRQGIMQGQLCIYR
jgi:hypothetical protein